MTSAARCRQAVAAAAVFSALAAAPAVARIHFGANGESRPRGAARPAAGLIVAFRSGVGRADQEREIGDAGGRLGLRLRLVRAFAVTPGNGETLEALRARLKAAPGVLRVEDNTPNAVAKKADDPRFERSTRSPTPPTTTSTRPPLGTG